MKNINQKITECGVALLGMLFAQVCFLHGSNIGNTHVLLLITMVMELVVLSYLVVSLLQFVWHCIKTTYANKRLLA